MAGLLDWLDRPPPGTAIVDAAASRSWSYAGLAAEIGRRAAMVASPRKSVVACLCRAEAQSAIDYLAAVAAGHAVMLIDAGTPRPAIARLLELYQVEFLLEAGTAERLRDPGAPIDDDLAVLLSTSGSTGTAKYVRLSRRNLETNAAQIARALGLDHAERAVQNLPLHYSYGLSVLNSHLHARATVVFPGASMVRPRFWSVMRDQACTSMAGVPYTYSILTRIGLPDATLPRLRTLTQAGGRMEPQSVLSLARHMAGRGGRLVVMYGQTEATARIACLPPERVLDKPDRVGAAVPGGTLSLAGDGELLYEGANVMLGYAERRADLSAGDVNRGRLATGDLAVVDDEGFYAIVGRKKRIAKLSGQRINLDELERVLVAHGAVAALEAQGRLVLARSAEGARTPLRELTREVRDLVGLPTRFLRVLDVERLPRTSTGKTDYPTLEDELRSVDE